MMILLQHKPLWFMGLCALSVAESYAFHLKPRSLIYMTPSQLTGKETTLPLRTKLWVNLPIALSLAPIAYCLFTTIPKYTLLEKIAMTVFIVALRTMVSGSIKIPFTNRTIEFVNPYDPGPFKAKSWAPAKTPPLPISQIALSLNRHGIQSPDQAS